MQFVQEIETTPTLSALRPDGTAYDEAEVAFIRRLAGGAATP